MAKTSLNGLGTKVLVNELRKRSAKVGKLEVRRDKHLAIVAAINAELALIGGSTVATKRGPGRPPKATKVVKKTTKVASKRGPGRPKMTEAQKAAAAVARAAKKATTTTTEPTASVVPVVPPVATTEPTVQA